MMDFCCKFFEKFHQKGEKEEKVIFYDVEKEVGVHPYSHSPEGKKSSEECGANKKKEANS
jgi:hypothetical protein